MSKPAAGPEDHYPELENLPPTQFELEEQRHAQVTRQNEQRERRRVCAANREAGLAQPRPGDKMHVSIGDRALLRRTRAGIGFEGNGVRKTVEVTDLTDQEVTARQAEGKDVVNIWGAERILADSIEVGGVLAINQRQAPPEELDSVRRANAALEEENRVMREDLRKLREARQGAKDAGDGSPARLQAQREAKAAIDAERAKAPKASADPDFGKDPAK